MYCSETWVQRKAISSSLKSADVKTVERITGVNYKNRVANKAVFKSIGPVDLDKIKVLSRLRWFDHVHRRENYHAVRLTDHVSKPGKRPEENSKKRWVYCVKRGLNALGLKSQTALIEWHGKKFFSEKLLKCQFQMSNPSTMGKRTISPLVVVEKFLLLYSTVFLNELTSLSKIL